MVRMTNPLLTPSSLPYSLPNWAEIRAEHIAPAVREAFRLQREAWEAVATNPEPPSVENTVVAVDASSDIIAAVLNPAYTLFSSIGGDELEAIEAEIGPEYSAHFNAFRLDERIYKRYVALQDVEMDEESAYVVAETVKMFERSGIALPAEAKEWLKTLDAELSSKEIEFSQRVVKAMTDAEPVFTDPELLAGIDADTLASWEKDGSWRVPIVNFSNQPVLVDLEDPATRRVVLDASLSRGCGAAAGSDTRALVADIARLRAGRAQLLGKPFHAQVVAEAGMAKDSDAIIELLESVARPAVAAVERDAVGLAELAATDPTRATYATGDSGVDAFGPADWIHYAEKERAKVAVSDEELRPYLELQTVVEKGIFFAAGELYGLRFEPRPDLAGYLPSVRTWEVFDDDGAIGLFQADFYARKGKAGGAWMNSLVDGSGRSGLKPVIMNNCNFPEPAEGKKCMLTWDNVETLFHEFGHALHGLLTKTHYLGTAGTDVPRDFVELPSQLNEMWAYNPRVLANYAVNPDTGEALPAEMVERIVRSKTFGQGFATTEFVAAALVDQAWHRLAPEDVPGADGVEAFEAQALEQFGVGTALVPPRYRSTYFSHTFGGGYDAGYYSYMWAEVLVADIEDWFRGEAAIDGDGGLNRTAGGKLRAELLSRGGSRDPMESFVAVRGRAPRAEALLERRGLDA